MGDGISEMANFLTKALQSRFGGQSDEVVGDRKNRPVCLDACPGSHKHFPEAQMLLDVLVKDLDGESLRVDPRHFGFRHVELVGDEEAALVSQTGDKKFYPSHLRQPDDLGSDPKPFFPGNPHPLVRKPPLGQKKDSDPDSVQKNVTVLFQGRHKSPACLLNRVENWSTSVPSIHDDGEALWEQKEGLLQDFQGQIDFASESSRLRDFSGPVAADGKDKTQCSGFQKGSNGAQTVLQSLGRMMQPQTFDVFALSGSQGIVENQKDFFQTLCQELAEGLKLLLNSCDDFGSILEKMMQTVGIAFSEMSRYFLDRAKFYEPNQAREVNQKVGSLGFRQNLQEMSQIGRNLFGALFAHGFRALLAFLGIGDFGRKPFYLKDLSLSVT